jgi:hypothetical protein
LNHQQPNEEELLKREWEEDLSCTKQQNIFIPTAKWRGRKRKDKKRDHDSSQKNMQ